MAKCEIRWIDRRGNPTSDSNDAIQLARTIKRDEEFHGTMLHHEASDWFPICAEHSKRLSEPGMDIWETKPLEKDNV